MTGADSSTATGRTSPLEFDPVTNKGISLPETIPANPGNKQPVRKI